MGTGRRMKKQGMPMSLEELGIDRKRKSQARQEEEPTKLVKLDRALRQKQQEKQQDRQPPKKKARLVNEDAQITVPPPLPASTEEEDDIEEAGSEDLSADAAQLLPDGSDVSSESDSVLASGDDEPQQKAMFSEDENSDAVETLNAANIEGLSRKLDAQQAQIEAEAQAELEEEALQTNIADPESTLDPLSSQQIDTLTPDLKLLHSRITETVRILSNFSKRSDKARSRSDYLDQLTSDISLYYSYTPYLASKLLNLFTPDEALAFFEANERPRPITLRTNTLRTNRRTLAQSLINRGVQLQPVGKWSKIGLQVYESPVPLGATPEYLAGHYILQAASSFLPVMALDPQPNERVLDMSAAPGGKTTHISALMRNTGAVFANDASKVRAKGLIGNIHRLGCKNVIVCNYEAQKAFPTILGGFDRVLLDAPCSGTGVIAKDPSVKTSKTERDFILLPEMQKKLLLAAIDSTDHASKEGGVVVYSTCSVTVEENESVVQYALQKRPNVRLVDTGLGSFGSPGLTSFQGKQFHKDMHLTRRYFPHRENVDGFFVSKFKKHGPTKTGGTKAVSVNGGGNTKRSVKETLNGQTEDMAKDGVGEELNGEAEMSQGVDFGGFDSEEDRSYIEKAEKKWRRAQGLDPRATSTHGTSSKLKSKSK